MRAFLQPRVALIPALLVMLLCSNVTPRWGPAVLGISVMHPVAGELLTEARLDRAGQPDQSPETDVDGDGRPNIALVAGLALILPLLICVAAAPYLTRLHAGCQFAPPRDPPR